MSVNSSWEGNSTKWDTHINSENETLLCQFNPTSSNQAAKKAPAAMLPVLLSLAGIQLLDHGAPPQHEFNSSSAVLLLDLFLKQLSRVTTLQ